MGLSEIAAQDLQSIWESPDGLSTSVTFKSAKDSTQVTVKAVTDKIMVDVEVDNGAHGVAERTTVAVHEGTLLAAAYQVRDDNGDVAMNNDTVTFQVFGAQRSYKVKMQMPDQKLGMLVFLLEDYNG